MQAIAPHRRPFYPPTERMEILELRAARGWTVEQTAEAFLVTPATIRSWMQRLNECGAEALVQLRSPVNKYPEFVRYAVQRLKVLCPALGKKKLAEVLARAGLHLGASTIGRMRKEAPHPETPRPEAPVAKGRIVTAKRPNHVWHVDLTTLPTLGGMWAAWLPFALPQCWPFCWWLAVVLDHHSRRIMATALFWNVPTSVQLRAFLGHVIRSARKAPRYLITDKGRQFWPSRDYKRWCRRHGITARFGAIGKHGSIALVERAIRSLKETLRNWSVPFRRDAVRRMLLLLVGWYNEHRPHTPLGGTTPNEVYFVRYPANRRPRIEPRPAWPRGSPCAQPHALVAGKPGARFDVEVERIDGRRELPIIRLRRAA
jgi:transposase InsO family protein